MKEEIILPDSDKAAKRKRVTGWVSRNGHFWGEDERMARYDGSTHSKCDDCGCVIPKSQTLCFLCNKAYRRKVWEEAKRKPWDGSSVIYSETGDHYFPDLEDLQIWCEEGGCSPEDLCLYLCEPNYAREIDDDFFCDELGEDDEIPDDLRTAMDAFNAAVRAYEAPLSWSPTSTAAIVNWSPVRAREEDSE